MFRKIALCTMLVLILATAAVMAAGQQGQAQGIGNEAGNGLHVQQKTASETMTQEKFQYGQGQGVKSASQNGDALMNQTRSCDQACEKDQARVRNMTRDQIRLNADAGPANENQGAGSNGDAKMLQTRSCDQACEKDQARVQNMTRDQVQLGSDSVQQQDGLSESVQNRFGLTMGNGQNFFASFADQMGARFRHAGGMFRTLEQ